MRQKCSLNLWERGVSADVAAERLGGGDDNFGPNPAQIPSTIDGQGKKGQSLFREASTEIGFSREGHTDMKKAKANQESRLPIARAPF